MTLKVYRSSAGSGKTFTLALEYLSLALASPHAFRSILGVTFTNKAAHEMKSRILKFLQVLADEHHADTKLRSLLLRRMQESGHGDAAQINEKAFTAFHQILHTYGDFSISTIDAFVYRLVRTFSRDVALPSQFGLILDNEDIVSKLTDRLFERVGTDGPLTEHLIGFLLENMDEKDNMNIEASIAGFCTELLNERSVRHARALSAIDNETFKNIRQSLRRKYQNDLNELIALAEKTLNTMSRHRIAVNDLYQGKSGAGGQLVKLIETKNIKDFFNKKNVQNAIAAPQILFSQDKESSWPVAAVDELKSEFREIGNWYSQKYQSVLLLSIVLPELNTLALTSQLFRETEELIREEQIVHISEFNKRVAGLLAESGVPFIYERLGERYHHFLLDEFQDTSVLQWSNFLPLIDNGLSAGYSSLIVGDAKQAIYRWRNGEVELFVRLPEIPIADEMPQLQQYTTTLQNHYEPLSLSTNFRSSQEIVKFNNNFFSFVADFLPEAYRSIYADSKQTHVKTTTQGFVSLSFIKDEEDAKAKEIATTQLVETIRHLVDEGYALGDIAVLCAKNNECSAIARRLTAEGIKIVSPVSLQLNSSAAVNAVVAALRSLLDDDDRLVRTELTASLAAHHNEPELMLDTLKLQSDAAVAGFDAETLKDTLLGHSIYDLTESIIRMLRLDEPFDPFLQFFLDQILVFQTAEGDGLAAFLRHWEDNLKKKSIILPDDKDAVTILTVHKAKGLEFPVVLIPYGDFRLPRNDNKHIWVDLDSSVFSPLSSAYVKPKKIMLETPLKRACEIEEEKTLLDYINLTYVAFTRPEDRLYIFFPLGKNGNKSSNSDRMRQFLQHCGLWEDEKLNYTFGLPQPRGTKETDADASNLKAEKMPSGRQTKMYLAKSPVKDQARDFGIRVHQVLAALRWSADLDRLVESHAALGVFTSHESIRLRDMLHSLLNLPELKELYAPPAKVFNEATFTDGEGKLFRVDRYVELNGLRTIIEYKTGSHEPEHLTQLKHYMHQISEIEGAGVKGILVYLSDKPELIRA
ncbi:MAG TPA: UvrD-helicase domain-containing protein [Bacteroidales bacterium]|nr:UvrD-helicase domain-containing protein [Bacteroidales bacterium]